MGMVRKPAVLSASSYAMDAVVFEMVDARTLLVILILVLFVFGTRDIQGVRAESI